MSETKNCPRCAEEVKAAALVCHFCGHEFSEDAEPEASPGPAEPEAAAPPSAPASALPPPPAPPAPPPPPTPAYQPPTSYPAPPMGVPATAPPPAKSRGKGCLIRGLVALVVLGIMAGVGGYLYYQREHDPMRTHYRDGIKLMEPTVPLATDGVAEVLALNRELGTTITTVEQLEPRRKQVAADLAEIKAKRAEARKEFEAVLEQDDLKDVYRKGANLFIDYIDGSNKSMDEIVAELNGITPADLSGMRVETTRTVVGSNALFWEKREKLIATSTEELADLD